MIIIPFITQTGRVGRGFLEEEVPGRQVKFGLGVPTVTLLGNSAGRCICILGPHRLASDSDWSLSSSPTD